LGKSLGVQKIGNPNPDLQCGTNKYFHLQNFSFTFTWHPWRWWPIFKKYSWRTKKWCALETAEFPRFAADNVTPILYDGVYASGPNAGQPNTINVDQSIMVIWESILPLKDLYMTPLV
jgi:hypothetical protein